MQPKNNWEGRLISFDSLIQRPRPSSGKTWLASSHAFWHRDALCRYKLDFSWASLYFNLLNWRTRRRFGGGEHTAHMRGHHHSWAQSHWLVSLNARYLRDSRHQLSDALPNLACIVHNTLFLHSVPPGITTRSSQQEVPLDKPALLTCPGPFSPGDNLLVDNSVGIFGHYSYTLPLELI